MKRRFVMRLRLVLVGIYAAVALPLCADEPTRAPQRAPAAAGWRAFRDPHTGKLREPTPEEALALSRDPARKSAAPMTFEVIVHPDGTKSVDLQGAFLMSLVARRNADGSISYECRPTADAARKPQGARGTASRPPWQAPGVRQRRARGPGDRKVPRRASARSRDRGEAGDGPALTSPAELRGDPEVSAKRDNARHTGLAEK